ncbi:MAG TPA: hypothetical protein EYN69_06545 [Flavobacteriales bacterium]|nr:hypothetical protein [Flavobacteriales bacterium]
MDFSAFLASLPQYVEIVVQVVGAFALIAALTPNSSDNSIADFLLRLVNTLGANLGKAANK